jgi:GPI-anchor transamidase subunit K
LRAPCCYPFTDSQFFKFQDEEELTAHDIANVLERMHTQKRYHQLLFIADTCQAFTLFDKLSTTKTPNVLALGSSLRGQNAYAHHCKYSTTTHAYLT